MSKIGNKDLASALIERHGLSKQEAERFVAAMFAVLGEGLAKEKLAKVKGLGTFKVVSVASRKSVDVNTGEPIVIEGRDKISFTPDNSLRDEVNKPFAQFDTVVVNDGVDFSEIDQKFKTEEEQTVEDEAEQPAAEEEQAFPEEEQTEAEEEPVTTETVPSAYEEFSFESAQPANTPADENNDEATQDTHDDNGETEAEAEDAVAENNEEEAVAKSEEAVQPISLAEEPKSEAAEEEPAESYEEEEESSKQNRTLKYIIAAAAALIIVLMGGTIYMVSQLKLRDNRIEHLEAQVMSKVATAKPTAKPKATVKPVVATEEPVEMEQEAKEIATPEPVQQKATPAPTPKTSVTAPKAQETKAKISEAPKKTLVSVSTDYDKDPRVRTGAYNIVGIDKTVTVKAGQTISSISSYYLGPGMECYVEAVNGGRTEIKAGDKIRIPKLELKKKRK